ncbi:hypothetical protein BDZ97DRAFT_1845319 [Flammula alnicola]|nr:hypothetical protein BDZ97DRAFT_1845319 [Flammula alnicola]
MPLTKWPSYCGAMVVIVCRRVAGCCLILAITSSSIFLPRCIHRAGLSTVHGPGLQVGVCLVLFATNGIWCGRWCRTRVRASQWP